MKDYPKFVDNHVFYKMHDQQDSEAQMVAMLNNMKEVFSLSHTAFTSFSELVKAYIAAGIKIFGLNTGIVSRIHGELYTVVDVVSPLDVIQPGDEYPLEGTYCREVFDSNQVLGFPHVGRLPFMKDHPVYQNLKLEAYLSAPIEVDGKLFGTLNFTSTEPRQEGFSVHEQDLIRLMGQAIGNYLLIQDREKSLSEANLQLKKFVGFVAHDLRNPLGNIKAYAHRGITKDLPKSKLIAFLKTIENISSITLEFVHSVLDLAALGTGKLEAKIEPVLLDDIVRFATATLTDLQLLESTPLRCEYDKNLKVQCDNHLILQVVINLLMNAIKYSPPGQAVLFQCTVENNFAYIKMHNEKKYMDESAVDRRFKSVGFGLDISKEVLLAHKTELHISESADIFNVEFRLPAV